MSLSHTLWIRPLAAATVAAGLLAGSHPAEAAPAGRFEALGHPSAVLIAAPHGGFDLYSDDMARQAALLGGFGYLLASGFRTRDLPINVNRPTMGVGLSPDEETHSIEAGLVFARYAIYLKMLSPQLYVEFHGNSRKESAGAIEVACKGIDTDDREWLKAEFDRRLGRLPAGMARIPLKIEGLETVHYQAAANKRDGAISLMTRALHFEVPYAVRADEAVRSRYATTLALTLRAFAAREGIFASP